MSDINTSDNKVELDSNKISKEELEEQKKRKDIRIIEVEDKKFKTLHKMNG